MAAVNSMGCQKAYLLPFNPLFTGLWHSAFGGSWADQFSASPCPHHYLFISTHGHSLTHSTVSQLWVICSEQTAKISICMDRGVCQFEPCRFDSSEAKSEFECLFYMISKWKFINNGHGLLDQIPLSQAGLLTIFTILPEPSWYTT